jgi:hypothetical protein
MGSAAPAGYTVQGESRPITFFTHEGTRQAREVIAETFNELLDDLPALPAWSPSVDDSPLCLFSCGKRD